MGNLETCYQNSNEDARLSSTKSRRIEFLTTTRTLQRYIKSASSILDIGAGTGCYSFHFSKQGHSVVARDIVPRHIELLHANPLMQRFPVDAGVGDARDLSEFPDAAFDAVLCLGPLYHLGSVDERKRCLAECLRVVKENGILAVAYINKFFVYAHMVRRNREYLADTLREQIMKNEVALAEDPDNLWFFDSPSEVEALLEAFDTQKLANIGTDGIAILLYEVVDSFDDAQFEQWLKYHFATCEEPSILGYSNHGLYVCRKKSIG